MTLVIAGHLHKKADDYGYNDVKAAETSRKIELDGLFVVADSAITTMTRSGEKTLMNGLKKIHDVEIVVWKPYFGPGGTFYEYREVYERSKCFIAFAGSTLTAMHILNVVAEHIQNLRISHIRNEGAIEYCIIRHCAKNLLDAPGTYYADDVYPDKDFQNLLTADVVADVIDYSINEAIRSAAKYKLELDDFNAMKTELIAGIWCKVSKKHKLYTFKWKTKSDEDGALVGYAEKQLVNEGEVAVIGVSNLEPGAQIVYTESLRTYSDQGIAMFDYLNKEISDALGNGGKYIDRPSYLKTFSKGVIKVSKLAR